MSEIFFEEMYKENELQKCKIVRGPCASSDILIALLVPDSLPKVKIYQLSLLSAVSGGGGGGGGFAINSMRCVSTLSDVIDLYPFNVFAASEGSASSNSKSAASNVLPVKVNDIRKRMLK